MGPTENLTTPATAPNCLATEKSGQFLYVGYRFGNFTGMGALNEFLIDAANQQLIPLPGQPTTDISSSPIGMVSDPKGLHLYVGLGFNLSTQMQSAGTNVYSIDPLNGTLAFTGTAGSAITAGKSIAIDPRGRFFFDGWGTTQPTIDTAIISPSDGTAITGVSTLPLGAGQVPEAMLADASGKFLYVQQGTVPVVYSINQTAGTLSPTGATLAGLNFSAAGAAADPLGPYLYSLQSDGVHGFLIDSQLGALSEIAGSPFGGATALGALGISGSPVQAVSGPVAALFPASENFGGVTVSQSSNSQLISLTNTGGQPLALNSLGIAGTDQADFLATPNCPIPTVVSPNDTCTVSVRFVPVAAGSRLATLTAVDNAPGSPQSIPLNGLGVSPQPAVTLSPASLLFATTAQGIVSAAQITTVTSAGTATLHISSVLPGGANPGDFQLTHDCSGALPPNSSCTLTITFSPLGAGQRTATVTIADDAPGAPQSLQLAGTGAATPPGKSAVSLSSSNISFGNVTQGVAAAAQSVTLTSSGAGALHISSVALAGTSSGDFSLLNNCTASAYAVGAACTVRVSLTPLTTGLHAATLLITDDAPNSPQSIAITANVDPAFSINPALAGGTTVTVTAGQTAGFSLLITPGPGFAGNLSFACTGVPADASCLAPALQLAGVPVTYVVNVTTKANSVVRMEPLKPTQPPSIIFQILLCLALAAFFVLVSRSSRFSFRPFSLRGACICVACFALFSAAGCGGGATASPQSVPTPQVVGTPRGTSTIVLTPSATTSAGTALPATPPMQLTLIVQ
jgi:hypothetical protein